MMEKHANRYTARRIGMIESQLRGRGIKDTNVLWAMESVARHLFVPKEQIENAYFDTALPIGHEQTISQPYIVALMCELANLAPTDRVLEIGTGSGYEAAVLGLLCEEVFSIEIVQDLGEKAGERLKDLGYENVHVKISDGYTGWRQHSPYDAIIITAETAEVPQPLVDQLKMGGKIIMPLGNISRQELVRFTKEKYGLKKEGFGGVRFVPLRRKVM